MEAKANILNLSGCRYIEFSNDGGAELVANSWYFRFSEAMSAVKTEAL
jgi:hypothetical protein